MRLNLSSFGNGALLLALTFSLACARHPGPKDGEPVSAPVLLIVIDGLRVDYATPELMPHLTELGAAGVIFENHRAVFPTLTQVNAASLVTGAWPSAHGILGNTLYDPRYFPEPLPIEWAGVLENLDRASGGRALTALTLGELLEGEDRDLLVVTSGSSGLAWILGYGAEPRPGRSRMISPDLVLPSEIKSVLTESVGPAPSTDSNPAERDTWAVKVFCQLALGETRPDLSILWLSGLEAVQQATGVGSPDALEAVREVDRELGKVTDALREAGLFRETNLLITADHGFVHHSGNPSLPQALAAMGFEESLAKGEIILAGHAIYLNGEMKDRLGALVRSLALQASVGALLTPRPQSGRPSGRIEGTFSYETMNYDHERAGDILVIPNWNDDHPDSGYPGLASGSGPAGSGGASPYELQVPLVVSGPAFRKGARTDSPSAHVDLAPTVLRLLGIDVPDSMEGRILMECLREGEGSIVDDPILRTYRARMRFDGEAERITELGQQGFEGVTYPLWIRALYRPPTGAPDPPGATGAGLTAIE